MKADSFYIHRISWKSQQIEDIHLVRVLVQGYGSICLCRRRGAGGAEGSIPPPAGDMRVVLTRVAKEKEMPGLLFLVSTAGCRTDKVGLISQSHGIFCLLPYKIAICICFLCNNLIINSLRAETISYFLQHLVCTSFPEEIVKYLRSYIPGSE